MKIHQRRPFWPTLFFCLSLIIAFQNCSPAQLTIGPSAQSNTDQSALDPNGAPPSAQAPTPPPGSSPGSPPPIVHFSSRINKTIYFSLSGDGNGTALELWQRLTAEGQNFVQTSAQELRSLAKCLEAPTTSGDYIFLNVCNGSAQQHWSYNTTTGELANASGFCASAPTGNAVSGARVSVEVCTGQLNQKWNVETGN